jgi:hypothetical protein
VGSQPLHNHFFTAATVTIGPSNDSPLLTRSDDSWPRIPNLVVKVHKTFFKTDYRGLVQLLTDFSDLRADLGLDDVPHYSTLCKAAARLLKKGSSPCSFSKPPRAPKNAA